MAGVPKSVVRNVPRYRLGKVPNFQGRNSIQSIILRTEHSANMSKDSMSDIVNICTKMYLASNVGKDIIIVAA